MEPSVEITPNALESLQNLAALLPHIEPPFLLETALALTLSLYEKSDEGASFTVTYADGKSEELRFKVKRPAKAKGKTKLENQA